MKVVKISHPKKILFPKEKISKEEVALYYLKVAKRMLPLIKDRPISMHRFPKGIKNGGFFQKQAPETLPKWIKTTKVRREDKEAIAMILCKDKETLLWLANQNCITPHIFLSKMGALDLPDRVIFDLDPFSSKKDFSTVVEAALGLRKILEKEMKLKAFVMTTGSKGIHVVVPILQKKYSFEKTRAFAHLVAEKLVKQNPKKFTLEMRKDKRKGRVYIDTLRNGFAQTSVAPYALRALDGAPVATPLFWKELQDKKLRPDLYTLRTIHLRLRKNPWAGMERARKSLP